MSRKRIRLLKHQSLFICKTVLFFYIFFIFICTKITFVFHLLLSFAAIFLLFDNSWWTNICTWKALLLSFFYVASTSYKNMIFMNHSALFEGIIFFKNILSTFFHKVWGWIIWDIRIIKMNILTWNSWTIHSKNRILKVQEEKKLKERIRKRIKREN